MRTLHTSARPVSRQGTIVFDPRVPATPRVPLRCVRYYDAKIRFRSTKTLCRAGSGVAHSGGVMYSWYYYMCAVCVAQQQAVLISEGREGWGGGGGGLVGMGHVGRMSHSLCTYCKSHVDCQSHYSNEAHI